MVCPPPERPRLRLWERVQCWPPSLRRERKWVSSGHRPAPRCSRPGAPARRPCPSAGCGWIWMAIRTRDADATTIHALDNSSTYDELYHYKQLSTTQPSGQEIPEVVI